MKQINKHSQKEKEQITTKIVKNEQECEYCGKKFIPKRRFVQKYCGGSCRVMAHNNPGRKHIHKKARNLPEKQNEEQQALIEKQKNIATIKQAAKEIVEDAFKNVFNELKNEIFTTLKKNNRETNSKISTVIERQQYHMLISAIMPLIAEPLRQRFIHMANNKNTPKTYEEFICNIEPHLKTVSPEVREQLIKGAKAYYKVQKK